MVGEWRQTTIGDFSPFSYGKGLPAHGRNANGNVPVFGSNGFVGFHDSPLTEGPTVIIGRKGTVGAVHYSPVPCWPIDTTFWISESDHATLRFKYYLLKSLGLDRMNSDSAVPGLNREAAHARQIVAPPLPEQRAIAHILGTLDDKIELNRRMNQTLEAMAQALFKSWFVDFEPFRAQGMQDSPLGDIPVGWETGTLGQICEVKMGQSPPGHTYNEIGEGIPFYQGIKDFGSRFPHHRVYCTMPARFAEPYDVLLSVRAPVGRLNVANERCAIGRGLAALCSKVRHHSYLYYLLNNAKNRWETFNSEGTVFGCITRKDIADVTVVIPPKTIVDRFESLVSTLDNLIALNEQEAFTLSSIRDTLLPKLLSGEIRLKDAEKFVERAL